MKPYKHLSGAQKRKKKVEESKKQSKMTKIDIFLRPSTSKLTSDTPKPEENVDHSADDGFSSSDLSPSTSRLTLDLKPNENIDRSANEDPSSSEVLPCSSFSSTSRDIEIKEIPSGPVKEPEQTECNIEPVSSFNSNNIFPTDRAHFTENVDDFTKQLIVRHGPCKPMGPFPKDPKQKNRHFSKAYYEIRTKTGMCIQRDWLCYSLKEDYVYCHPCWLFADRSSPHYHNNWVNGVRYWEGIGKKIKEHENSSSHLEACVTLNVWVKQKTIDTSFINEIEKETTKWYKVLHRIVNVTLTLASCNLAFRGHREQIGKTNSGNFLAIIELLAEYDPVLHELLSENTNQKYLSPTIQNELIQVLGDKVKTDIVRDINDAMFYSMIFDTTLDITKKDQLSTIIRYVTIPKDSSGKPTSLVINESFLGFKVVEDQSAGGLEEEILLSLQENNIPLTKCRGQGYDGAATMSGAYTGVKTRILEKQRTAKFVHCAAHNLNLVANDAMASIPENVSFFGILEQLFVFFSQSSKRWDLLSSSSRSLKKLCPTRWASRTDSLKALSHWHCYVDVMKALAKLTVISTKPKERAEAMGLKKQLEKFSFVFQVVIQTNILEAINVASKNLQHEGYDLFEAASQLERAKEKLINMKNNFEEIKASAITLSEKWGVSPEFDEKRNRKVKKHFDELCQDERLLDSEKNFKVCVFCATLDIVISQLNFRFEAMSEISKLFSVLSPAFLLQAEDAEITKQVKILVHEYEEDLSVDLCSQLKAFTGALRPEIEKLSSIRQLAELLFLDNYWMTSSFPDLCTAFLLFLTLPVTVASAERSFSKLKLIKNYLRNTMAQERLSSLALLSIENKRAKKVNLDEVIRAFAAKKARRQKKILL